MRISKRVLKTKKSSQTGNYYPNGFTGKHAINTNANIAISITVALTQRLAVQVGNAPKVLVNKTKPCGPARSTNQKRRH